jgi:hypothetical protein
VSGPEHDDDDTADGVPFDPAWGERGHDIDLSDRNPDIPSDN